MKFKTAEQQYLSLLSKLVRVQKVRDLRLNRTATPVAASAFGYKLTFSTTNNYGQLIVPLLTTKHMSFDFVVSELCWFLSGSTNVYDLPAVWQHLWSPWADSDGNLGPTYGHQYRSGSDAFMSVLRSLLHDPNSRRHVISLWPDVDQVNDCRLPPCHGTVIQFYVDNGVLDMCTHQRSADVFLGLPYNLASYTVLLHTVANLVGLKSGVIHYSLGDAHLYLNHVAAAKQQLAGIKRSMRSEPTLHIDQLRFEDCYLDSFNITTTKYALTNYVPGPKLTAPVAI